MTESTPEPSSAILLAVGGLLHRQVALAELLQVLVDHVGRALDADRATLYLVDRASRSIVSRSRLPELGEIRLALGQGVAGFVAETGEVVNVPTTSTDARFFAGVDRQTGYKTESILAAPIRDRFGAIVGVIQLLNKRGGHFPKSDEATIRTLAEQAGLAIEATTLYERIVRPPPEALSLGDRVNGIVGESPALRQVLATLRKAARSEATILISGESGTGKELFARAVHHNSARQDGPFVKVDCAALPESLIENELFGHEAGAYTGAVDRAPGKFDAAAGGTLFLDELGELPLAVQGKLLGVLQDREFQRVGGVKPIRADVRVVAATNRDLPRLVAEGRFRADLYYRVKVVELHLPRLRDRGPGDIEVLARHFLMAAAKRHGRPLPTLTEAARERLLRYPWPGNVRELENCLESAVVIADGPAIGPADLPLADRPTSLAPVGPLERSTEVTPPVRPSPADSAAEARIRSLADVERDHILAALRHTGGNRGAAAKLLGIGRNTLTRKLAELDPAE